MILLEPRNLKKVKFIKMLFQPNDDASILISKNLVYPIL